MYDVEAHQHKLYIVATMKTHTQNPLQNRHQQKIGYQRAYVYYDYTSDTISNSLAGQCDTEGPSQISTYIS